MLRKISILIFLWTAILFFLNLSYDFLSSYNTIIFFFCIIIMIGVIIFQAYYLKYFSYVVLFEIFIVCLFLHLIYHVGYAGLNESDSYLDYKFLKSILSNHNFTLEYVVSGWPMIHTLAATITLYTKIDSLTIAKFLPSFLSSLIILPIYLLINSIYKDKLVAFLSCLVFVTIPQFMLFDSLFVRETFGFFIFPFLFYMIYMSKKMKDFRYTFLGILLVPIFIFGHHLSCFMFIILLSLYMIAVFVIPYLYRKNIQMMRNLQGRINIINIFLFILFAILMYWVFSSETVLEATKRIVGETVGTEQFQTYGQAINLGSAIRTLRGYIIFFGFFGFTFLFSLILFLKLILIKNFQKIEDFAFTFFLFFCLFYAALALYVLGSLPFPERFAPFGWMFGVIPLIGVIIALKKEVYKKIFVVLLVTFMIFNIYYIDPRYYTDVSSLQTISTEKEYLVVAKMNFSDEDYGYGGVNHLISTYESSNNLPGNSIFEMSEFRNSSGIAVIKEKVFLDQWENSKKSPGTKEIYILLSNLISLKNNININKIYDIGDIYVVQRGG